MYEALSTSPTKEPVLSCGCWCLHLHSPPALFLLAFCFNIIFFIDYLGISHLASQSHSVPSPPRSTPSLWPSPNRRRKGGEEEETTSPICVAYICTGVWSNSRLYPLKVLSASHPQPYRSPQCGSYTSASLSNGFLSKLLILGVGGRGCVVTKAPSFNHLSSEIKLKL